jgi:hypothetical protein
MFKESGILPLASQYLFSSLLFVSYNKALFSSNTDSHTIATRPSPDLHLPQANFELSSLFHNTIQSFNVKLSLLG